eukprot:scaffold29529_cov39-Tisochrysis_lutea.AAC.1
MKTSPEMTSAQCEQQTTRHSLVFSFAGGGGICVTICVSERERDCLRCGGAGGAERGRGRLKASGVEELVKGGRERRGRRGGWEEGAVEPRWT